MGIGMFEAKMGDGLAVADAIAFAWKSQYLLIDPQHSIPSSGDLYWLRRGYAEYNTIYSQQHYVWNSESNVNSPSIFTTH